MLVHNFHKAIDAVIDTRTLLQDEQGAVERLNKIAAKALLCDSVPMRAAINTKLNTFTF